MRTVAFVGIRDLKFTNVVYPGDTVRVQTKVLAKEIRGRGKRGEVVWQRTIVNQDGKPVQESVTVTLVECRPQKRDDGGPESPPAAAGGSDAD
jgi:acyl dehydratase